MVKKAVTSLTRAACCMLWVTITIVYCSLSSVMRSSMTSVETGSRAEHGSSMRRTSGSTAMARAMHSRCCCPPDRLAPGRPSRVDTSSQSPASRSERSTASSSSALAGAVEPQPGGDVVTDRHGGERVGTLEDHADGPADICGGEPGCVDVLAVEEDLALHPRAGHDLVHAVQRADERRLAAARRPDERRHLLGLDDHGADVLDGLVGAEPGADVGRLDALDIGAAPAGWSDHTGDDR